MKIVLCNKCVTGLKSSFPLKDIQIKSTRKGCKYNDLYLPVHTFICPKCGKEAESYEWGKDE
jgi:hypothetical protein